MAMTAIKRKNPCVWKKNTYFQRCFCRMLSELHCTLIKTNGNDLGSTEWKVKVKGFLEVFTWSTYSTVIHRVTHYSPSPGRSAPKPKLGKVGSNHSPIDDWPWPDIDDSIRFVNLWKDLKRCEEQLKTSRLDKVKPPLCWFKKIKLK